MSMTIESLDEKRRKMQADIEPRIVQFESDTGVQVASVTGNPRRVREDGERKRSWSETVRARLTL